MVVDRMIAREIDLRCRLVVLIAAVESEAYMLELPGLSPDAIARTVTRLKSAISDARDA